ncbi:MAG TPA: hypothetical protein VMW94_09775 [Actinomycetes bacterium]|nr:hypothetical protein [Actinomycetes bacterium]
MDRLNAFITRFKNEPAIVISILAAAVVAALQSLAGNEVIGADLVETVRNIVGTAEDPGIVVIILGGIVTRFFVFGPKSVAKVVAEAEAKVPAGYVAIDNP